MPGQVVNISNNEAIGEVALKCGDPWFKDFPRNIYSQAVFRAERSIAKLYGVMERSVTIINDNGDDFVVIEPLNFNGAWRITVTQDEGIEILYEEVSLEKVLDNVLPVEAETSHNIGTATASTNYYYHILFNANRRELYYTLPSADDEIKIYYTSSIAGEEDYALLDDEGNPQAIPVLPNKYFEETVRQAIRYMAKLGLAQYDGLKAQKYGRVLQVYTRNRDEVEERHLERSRPWIEIKPWYPA